MSGSPYLSLSLSQIGGIIVSFTGTLLTSVRDPLNAPYVLDPIKVTRPIHAERSSNVSSAAPVIFHATRSNALKSRKPC